MQKKHRGKFIVFGSVICILFFMLALDSHAEEISEEYSVSISSNGNGDIICNGKYGNEIAVEAGVDVNVQIIPNAGKYVAGLFVDGNELSISDENVTQNEDYSFSYIIPGISAEHDIFVEFADIPIYEVETLETVGLVMVEGNATEMCTREDENGDITYYLSNNQYLVIMPQNVEKQILMGTQFQGIIEIWNSQNNICDSLTIRNTSGNFAGSVNCYNIDKEYHVIFDRNNPTIQCLNNITWLQRSTAGISLGGTVSDVGTGVDKVVWFDHMATLDEIAAETTHTAEITDGVYSINDFNVLFAEGENEKIYYIYVVDFVGNFAYTTVTYKMDAEPPEASFTVNGFSFDEDDYFSSTSNVQVRVNVNDNGGSGVSRVSLSVNGTEYATQSVYDSCNCNFDVYLRDAITDILVYVYDYAGNSICIDSQGNRIYLDENEPELLVDIEGVLYTADDVLYSTEDVLLNIEYSEEKENDSGLAEVSIFINGMEVTEDVSQNSISSNYLLRDETVWSDSYTISTSQVESSDDEYLVEIFVTDKAGNEVSYTCEIHKDNEAPEIVSYTVEGSMADGTIINSTVHGGFHNSIEGYYRYYARDNIVLVLHARDNAGGVGVKCVTYQLRNSSGNYGVSERVYPNANGYIYISIPANFKGNVLVSAIDLLGNEMSSPVCLDRMVIETENHFYGQMHIVAELPDTPYYDSTGIPLYADDVTIPVEIRDDFAGIRSAEWSILVEGNVVRSGMISVDENGNVSGEGWEIISREENMIVALALNLNLTENYNAITLKIKMTNGIGYTEEQNIILSIDKTKPSIAIELTEGIADEVYSNIYKGNCYVTVTVEERNFAPESVILQVNFSGYITNITPQWRLESNSNATENTYSALLSFEQDGIYQISAMATDCAGNKSDMTVLETFSIDQTVPQISVTFDNMDFRNEYFFNGERVAEIYVEETNFDASRFSVIGNTINENFPLLSDWQPRNSGYVAYLSFEEDGVYSFVVQGSDKAGNEASAVTVENFCIDMEAPNISIEGVRDMSANNGDLQPIIKIMDENLAENTIQITLTGANHGEVEMEGEWYATENGQIYQFDNFPYLQEMDDLYKLEVSAEDLAGNITYQSIQFSVNRFGSVYTMDPEAQGINGTYIREPIDLIITETNVDRLHPDSITLVLTINGIPYTLVNGSDYEVLEHETQSLWKQYTYRIYRECFQADGTYDLAIYSTDEAGNLNENRRESKCATIRFGVDGTAPIVIPLNIENYGIYDGTSLCAEIDIIDNLLLEQVIIELDGMAVEYAMSEERYQVMIQEGNEVKNIRIIAYDASGNITVLEVNNFVVSSNPFVRWYSNRIAFWLSVISVLAIVGVTVFFFKKKMKIGKHIYL